MSASHSQTEAIIADLQSALARVRKLVADLPAAKWNTRNDVRGWSVAECIEHLNLTTRAFIPLLEDALSRAPQRRDKNATFRHDFAGGLLKAMTGPIRRIGNFRIGKMPTTPQFEPGGVIPRDELVQEFERDQQTLIDIVRRGENLGMDRVKVVSPFNSRMKYSAFSALVIIAGHQHRHLEQAESVWSSGVRPATR
jgi:hypothetical protein